jgi:hypothetical protein
MINLMSLFRVWKTNRKNARRVRRWEKKGRPVPPPHPVKQSILKSYAERYNLKIFIETGTFKGDMVNAMEDVFEKIYSIELSAEFYENARKRFDHCRHVTLIHGDSGIELKNVMEEIDRPALFWLDGHYSGGKTVKGQSDTPIYEELTHIFNAKDLGHVVLIDDARCFETEPSYPNLEDLRRFVTSKRENVEISVENDIIRIVRRY